VPIVAVSSAAVYGARHQGAIAEASFGTPYSPYGHHKAIMEALCRSYGQNFGLRAAVVRVFSAYGSGLRKQILWDFCNRLASMQGDLVLDGTGQERRDWIHASDVARLLALIGQTLPSPEVPVVNGGTGQGHTVAEFTQLALAAWSAERPVRFSGASRPGDPVNLVADVARARELGFAPEVSLAEGIRAYVDWFRNSAGR